MKDATRGCSNHICEICLVWNKHPGLLCYECGVHFLDSISSCWTTCWRRQSLISSISEVAAKHLFVKWEITLYVPLYVGTCKENNIKYNFTKLKTIQISRNILNSETQMMADSHSRPLHHVSKNHQLKRHLQRSNSIYKTTVNKAKSWISLVKQL